MIKPPIDTLRVGISLTVLVGLVLLLREFVRWEFILVLPASVLVVVAGLAVAAVILGRSLTRIRIAVGIAAISLLLASIATLNTDDASELEWREHQTGQIVSVLKSVSERIDALQNLSATIGERVEAFRQANVESSMTDPAGWRLDLFRMLDDEAERITASGQLPRGTEIGIQLFDQNTEHIAWAGWPQLIGEADRRIIARGQEIFYTRQVSLYQILTHVIPIREPGDDAVVATVVVDLPLEVNYRVNNRFLNSTSVARDFADAAAADVRFDYYTSVNEAITRTRQTDPGGSVATLDSVVAAYDLPDNIRPLGRVSGDPSLGLMGRGTMISQLGNPLLGITVNSRPLRFYAEAQRERRSSATKALLIFAVAVMFGASLRRFSPRLAGPLGSLQALYVAGFIVTLRYMMLSFHPSHLIFDPAIFATPMLGGVMRSAGDLLITAVFFVGALYGVLKITREATSRGGKKSRPVAWLFVLKAILAAAILLGAVDISRRFITNVVVNANPRLVGETMRITELPTLILHLSTFLMIAGILLGGLILVWGVYRVRGRGDATRASLLAAVLMLVTAPFGFGWQVAAAGVLLLLFLVFAPRIVQREDLAAIVMVAFAFVIIVSASAYTFLNDDYQNLRRTFIQEKVAELTHPADNWKVFILEDVLEDFGQDSSIRQALRSRDVIEVQRLAFDLWAGSSLSLLGYSSAIHVFDEADSLVSRFTVEMPYRVRLADVGERLETSSSQEWVVLDLTTTTPQGIVRFYRGIVNIDDYVVMRDGIPQRSLSGKVVVDIPFHFENLNWAARTGPQTPEVLRNVQEGGISPRVEETEALLLARVRGARVLESSSDILPVGFRFPDAVFARAADLNWPLLQTSGSTYRFFVQELDEPGSFLLAGFPVPNATQHILRWSTILSLYFFFTGAIIILIVLLKSLPVMGSVLPTLTPGRQLGFQQKLLGSFLIVALLPAVFLSVFSVRLIKERFEADSKKEALYKSFSAYKSISNLVMGEMDYLFDHTDVSELLEGRAPQHFADDPNREIRMIDESGVVVGAAADAWTGDRIFDTVSPEEIFVHRVRGLPYVGVISEPFNLVIDGQRRTYHVYYGRRLEGELLGEIADQVGADVNLFDAGELIASSREGLLSGGFISSMMNSEAFVKVSLMDVDQSLVTETAGQYRYEVAYLPLSSANHNENAAIGVPLLFRPESFHAEVQKATSIVLSLFALLSAATIGLGLLLARGIFEPLRGLLEGTKRIARGDLSFKLPAMRSDEIGTVVTAFNEMTDRLSESQTALEERRRYLEVILANIATGVISTDADNRIQAINSAAEKILGIEAHGVMNRTTDDLIAGGVAPQFFALLSGGTHREVPFAADEVEIVRDGHKRTIKYMGTRLSTDGRYLGTVYVFEDLTELISTKKLSAWVEMSRQIAHEIKNPLTPIKLSAQFMVRAHQEKSADFDRIFAESSETIIQQVEVLKRIASEFSSFGRMQRLDIKPYAIAAQVEEIVNPYRRNTSGTQISLAIADENIETLADDEAVRKICTNLIENAMEAMPKGGRLDITCDETPMNGRMVVRVCFEDSGPGLSNDAKDKLFEPYFSTKTTGTGLGLAICRSLSREMGGDVQVENRRGGGVEATLLLPRA